MATQIPMSWVQISLPIPEFLMIYLGEILSSAFSPASLPKVLRLPSRCKIDPDSEPDSATQSSLLFTPDQSFAQSECQLPSLAPQRYVPPNCGSGYGCEFPVFRIPSVVYVCWITLRQLLKRWELDSNEIFSMVMLSNYGF